MVAVAVSGTAAPLMFIHLRKYFEPTASAAATNASGRLSTMIVAGKPFQSEEVLVISIYLPDLMVSNTLIGKV